VARSEPAARAEPAAPIDPFAQARRLGRGVNLGNALEAHRGAEGTMEIKGQYLQLIAAAGFDTIRVPIRWTSYALDTPPYTVEEAFFQQVDWVIQSGLQQGLNVVIDMHHYDALFAGDAGNHKERFVAIWRQIATRYRGMPDNLFYEPLNEPHGMLMPDAWNALVRDTVAAIRQVDGVHTLVISGTQWGNMQGLAFLEIPEGEENVICTFHYYEPFAFTHQGAGWVGEQYWTIGVEWPGPPKTPLVPKLAAQQDLWIRRWFHEYNTQPAESNPCSPGEIAKQLDVALALGQKLGKPLWLGEFGAYRTGDMQSRVNWTAAVRQAAEARGFSWAYWEFGDSFGVYDRALEEWHEGLLRALIPLHLTP
jgi:endoglucanase